MGFHKPVWLELNPAPVGVPIRLGRNCFIYINATREIVLGEDVNALLDG
jgi:hypothetical protein